jgi:DNA-binding transcriptional ArsR family regulator
MTRARIGSIARRYSFAQALLRARWACQRSGFPVWSIIIDHWDPTDYPADDTLVVNDPEQLRALAEDLRRRIISLLRERAWSTQQLARELDVPKGTVGHHLKVLERAGLIRVVHTRKVRAVTEKFYGRVARLFLFQIEDTAEDKAVGAATLRDAASMLERAPSEGTWGLVMSRLTPADVARFDRRLGSLLEDFRKADTPGGDPHRLAVAGWAVGRPEDAAGA